MTTQPFQSTHSLRSATHSYSAYGGFQTVSIHALLAECDCLFHRHPRRGNGFNPRTPCGVRPDIDTFLRYEAGFNPRTPCGVRLVLIHQRGAVDSFNPRTPCGVRLLFYCCGACPRWFQSTHSLRSATLSCMLLSWVCSGFQSTHSLRSATGTAKDCPLTIEFQSTHSLRSATVISVRDIGDDNGFNPRTPCGVRPRQNTRTGTDKRFQSTHSLRSATVPNRERRIQISVSIHALLAECDL